MEARDQTVQYGLVQKTGYRGDEQWEVGFAIGILQIGQLDSAEGTFFARIIIKMDWFDKGLIGKDEVETKDIPYYEIINNIDAEQSDMWVWVADSKTGHAHYTCLYTGKFFENYELRLFPFDVNFMHFIIRSSISPKTRFVPSKFGDFMQGRNFFLLASMPGFACKPEKSSCGYFDSTPNSENIIRNYQSHFVLQVYFERQLQYYMFNIFLMEYFFTSVSFLVYALEASAFGDILNVLLVLLLTIVAYRFVLADTVPKVSYLTAFDVYSLLSFGTLAAVLAVCFSAAS